MESSLLYTASSSFSELLEPTCVMDQTESSFYDSVASSPSVSPNCNPSCGNYNISYDTIHSPSCENFKNLSYEKFQRINTFPSPSYEVSAVEIFASPPYEMSQPRLQVSHNRYFINQQSNQERVSEKPKILSTNTISSSNANSCYNVSYQSTDSYFHKKIVRNQTPISNYKERLLSSNVLTYPDMPSSSTVNIDFQIRNQEYCELSPRQYLPPKSSPSLMSLPPPTLPTPPQSPPSSGSEEGELERLVRDIPEILEMPRNPKNSLPGVEDILRDLQFEGRVFSEFTKTAVDITAPSAQPQEGLRSPPAPIKNFCGLSLSDNEEFKPIRKDSMWCGGLIAEPQTPTVSKMRTVSESSEDSSYHCSDEQTYNSVYSDEEYGHLPETPYLSDEDADRHPNASPCPSPSSGHTIVTFSSNSEHDVSSSVSTDHDYYNKRLAQRKTNTATSAVSSTTVGTSPTTPSTEVKRHLQLLIHESIKNKQKRGRAPGKQPKETGDNCRIVPTQDDEFDPSESPQKGGRTIGKPASYTKRMRDQHTEVLKTTKRRKTTAKDPEDDLEKRSNHNIMERNRRVNIKNLFDELRQKVPEILGNERASKVLILKKSTDYIHKLESSGSQLELEQNILAQRRQYLEKKLHSMGMIQGL